MKKFCYSSGKIIFEHGKTCKVGVSRPSTQRSNGIIDPRINRFGKARGKVKGPEVSLTRNGKVSFQASRGTITTATLTLYLVVMLGIVTDVLTFEFVTGSLFSKYYAGREGAVMFSCRELSIVFLVDGQNLQRTDSSVIIRCILVISCFSAI